MKIILGILTFYEFINSELLEFSVNFESLKIPITDALRMQFLCDSQEGNDDDSILVHANDYGILDADREIPMPSTFMKMVRVLGAEYKILQPVSDNI